jgi:hypothetical protein
MFWLSPQEALHKFSRTEISLLPPQYCTLKIMSEYKWSDIENLVLNKHQKLETICPESVDGRNDLLALPGDTCHSQSLGSLKINRIKLYLQNENIVDMKWLIK